MKITKNLKLALKRVLSLAFGEVATDNGTLIFDGDELAVGMEVFVAGEGDELIPAADGEYVSEDKIFVVKDGVVAEIKDKNKKTEGDTAESEPAEPEEEEEETEEEGEEEEEESNTELAEEPAVDPIEEPAADPEKSVEDRLADAEAKIGEIVAGIQSILNAFAEIEGRLAEVENKLAKVEGTPAADPAEEPAVEEEMHTKAYYLRKQ